MVSSSLLRFCYVVGQPGSFSGLRAIQRRLSVMAGNNKGLVLGVYKDEKSPDVALTRSTLNFQTNKAGNLSHLISLSGLGKKGKTRVFYGLDPEYPSIAVVNLGKKGASFSELEELDEGRENVRKAVAAGVKELQDTGVKIIDVDPCGDPEAAAEGAHLCVYSYDDLKSEDKRQTMPDLNCFISFAENPDNVSAGWQRGTILAQSQNLARQLKEMPSNHLTPTRFAEIATETLGKLNTCQVTVRDQAWAEDKKMGAFLSVAKGSEEPLRFVELEYDGGKEGDAPFAIVGKGITFDTGGISLKPSLNMEDMRADMGGAACTLASIYGAALLKLPINLRGFIPLCENMPGGGASKPGDVVRAMNGKTIQIDNTDAEGRLVLSDALCYAQTFNPSGIINMATLTGAMGVALGAGATGVFSNTTQLWELLHRAGGMTGDRVWRMPLFNLYSKQIKDAGHLADLNNISPGRAGGSCTAAAFLREFVTHQKWMHLDIAGVMMNKSDVCYIGKGMSGRPTRTIIEFLHLLSQA